MRGRHGGSAAATPDVCELGRHRLALEPMDDNPHLESERIFNSTDDLTLSLYYNAEKPAKAAR